MRTINVTYEDRAFRKLEKIKKEYGGSWDRVIYIALFRLEEDVRKKDKKVHKMHKNHR